MIMFPQKTNNKWVVITWDKETLHAQTYRTFIRAAWEYRQKLQQNNQRGK